MKKSNGYEVALPKGKQIPGKPFSCMILFILSNPLMIKKLKKISRDKAIVRK